MNKVREYQKKNREKINLYKREIYKKMKNEIIEIRENKINEKFIKETYFDNFRFVKVKDLLKDLETTS